MGELSVGTAERQTWKRTNPVTAAGRVRQRVTVETVAHAGSAAQTNVTRNGRRRSGPGWLKQGLSPMVFTMEAMVRRSGGGHWSQTSARAHQDRYGTVRYGTARHELKTRIRTVPRQ